MVASDPRDALVLAHEHIRHLREETAAERLRRKSPTRRALADSLRRAADRLDRAPLAARPA
jgi:uncharacterized membrane protein YfbV (UPF0208 family)